MTDIITSLADIAGDYDAVLCDLWGVYHNGMQPYPEAVAALRAFRAGGGVVVLLTNAPRPDFSVAAQLAKMGAPHDTHDLIVSSGDATVEALKTGAFGTRTYHIGPQRDYDLFEGLDIEKTSLDEAEFILCSGLFDDATETPEDYADFYREAKARGLVMVCANPDIVVDRGERRIWCGGALAQAYEQIGGTARYFGKPHAPIYDLARARITAKTGRDIDPARILTIGDGPATDVKGAADNGFDSLFIAAGLGAEALLDADGVLKSDELGPWLSSQNAAPQKALAFLR